MFDLFKRDRRIDSFPTIVAAQKHANKLRGDERAQRFSVRKGRQQWVTMLPPKGQGRAKWEKVA